MRKTIEINNIKEKINGIILNSEDNQKEVRESLGLLLEEILMETNNYKGFKYLTKKDMELSYSGTTVGINDDQKGKTLFEGTDSTRIYYY
jgi:hypothetical protein